MRFLSSIFLFFFLFFLSSIFISASHSARIKISLDLNEKNPETLNENLSEAPEDSVELSGSSHNSDSRSRFGHFYTDPNLAIRCSQVNSHGGSTGNPFIDNFKPIRVNYDWKPKDKLQCFLFPSTFCSFDRLVKKIENFNKKIFIRHCFTNNHEVKFDKIFFQFLIQFQFVVKNRMVKLFVD